MKTIHLSTVQMRSIVCIRTVYTGSGKYSSLNYTIRFIFLNSYKYCKNRQSYLCPTGLCNHKGAEQTLITEIFLSSHFKFHSLSIALDFSFNWIKESFLETFLGSFHILIFKKYNILKITKKKYYIIFQKS